MPPRNAEQVPCSVDDELATETIDQPPLLPEVVKRPPMQIVWRNVIWFFFLHVFAIYGLYLLPFARPATWLWVFATYMMSGLGITAGAHRLWAHRAYRATLPLRIILAVFNSMAFQNDIIEWSRDHRLHHKYSETEADPHNALRGFFFSHCGWLMVRKHPEVKAKGKQIDMSDLFNDPVCTMQRKLYLPSIVLLCFVVPTIVPVHYWGESAWAAFFACGILRYTAVLNVTWTVNSLAHLFGNRPYDRRINPRENFAVAFSACGEGFHNYHHVFPSDYSTSEHGWKINPTTFFIDLMAVLGLASHRKTTSKEVVRRRMERTGDASTGFGWL